MTKKQAIFVIVMNAIISLIISVAVFRVWGRAVPGTVEPTVAATHLQEPSQSVEPPEMIVYVVQQGDSLYGIALEFDVSTEDLMRANGLVDPNFLVVGQELFIPVDGLPPAPPTPTDTPIPFEPPTPLSTSPPSGSQPQVIIEEVIAHGNYANEFIEIYNPGPPVRLEGWTLSDQQGHVYVFPNLSLGTGGSVRVHTGPGRNSPTDLYWGLNAAVWGEAGDVVSLRDNQRQLVAAYPLP
ncbi:MAG: lamin tail domain-containing protein [Anaerolineae bacterium]